MFSGSVVQLAVGSWRLAAGSARSSVFSKEQEDSVFRYFGVSVFSPPPVVLHSAFIVLRFPA